MRLFKKALLKGCFFLYLRAGLTKAPFALLVFQDGSIEVFLAEVGPFYICEIKFRIGKLVKQEIADPVFPTGPNHEFRIGESAGTEMFPDGLLCNC